MTTKPKTRRKDQWTKGQESRVVRKNYQEFLKRHNLCPETNRTSKMPPMNFRADLLPADDWGSY